MYTETSALDRAERGECHGDGSYKEAAKQDSGESSQGITLPTSQTDAPMADAQSDDIGEEHSPWDPDGFFR